MFAIENNKLLHNKRVIYEAIDKIYTLVFQDCDKAIIKYSSLDYAEEKGYYKNPLHIMNPKIENEKDFQIINGNVLCIDKKGQILWRIEPPALEKNADSFIHFRYEKKKNIWSGTTHMGHECVVDISTGKLLNVDYDATR